MNLLLIEELLLDKIYQKNEADIMYTYEEYYRNILTTKYDLGNGSDVRNIKNHLITLNQNLFNYVYKNIICKQYIYSMKVDYIRNIEKCNTLDELHEMGKKMVLYYSQVTLRKDIYVNNHVVLKALNYIHNHINDHLTLDIVSNSIYVSKNYLSRIFYKNTGYSFSDYINKIKIENSKIKLTLENKSILNIALECGYNSQSYFCSIFKKYTGITPYQYKKRGLSI